MHNKMACNKVYHGLPTLKNNQKTWCFCKICKIRLYKAQLICFIFNAQHNKVQCFPKACKHSATSAIVEVVLHVAFCLPLVLLEKDHSAGEKY